MAQSPEEYIDRIVVNPNVLAGKPVVRGTRISVELVLEHLAENPDLSELLAAYPHLTVDDAKACLAYAHAVIASEDVYPTVSASS